MTKPILEIRSLSKKFNLHHEKKAYLTFRESLGSLFRSKKGYDEDFWVLKDISFNIQAGESLGIIGRNGAGKSTLLKILSRISPPTSGSIISRGRIASLLEVGTGFHPELNGRENIFMNGSLLGMRRQEINQRFSEIVEFSGVEKFLDTPLKHYSSGMQLRLAFSVAAHLEPEILIIDEVLAVGDAAFQRKCLGKMNEISNSGRTILFVSHNFSAISSLCTSCIYLDSGRIKYSGLPSDVIQEYLKDVSIGNTNVKNKTLPGDKVARLLDSRMVNHRNEPVTQSDISEPFIIEFEYEILEEGFFPTPNIHVTNLQAEIVFVAIMPKSQVSGKKGHHIARLEIPADLLNTGTYIAAMALTTLDTMQVHFYQTESIVFSVDENMSNRPHDFRHPVPGVVRPNLKWL
jgi:lipopolysaccharide transport system ATP-binding protein